ncbi:antibiotic biosynthesis monooxygenase [Hazenella sp. IB182357]|uniref:Antibiotic biosynthesis monooxygenase n=1 Tax=Polycladospora coralii TaxID=2771432 RepID=A0A926N6K8_9BACL|nr:antibiotic biosynthesis monooxygenase family protein [Polycladospora coralii]MBD1372311.1 antibiotic biosynthesis monooxygenase [Polycladospora coralii]MBS7531499.1 antibiotic biosynthesis monooxygenase [Polycladospora coralii]
MYQVNNRIDIQSDEQLAMLKERFQNANESMKKVDGFISFRLLIAEDHSHIIAETIFEKKDNFIAWTESEHFKRAHGGRSGDAKRANIASYEIAIS